jgi:hypothetical protein
MDENEEQCKDCKYYRGTAQQGACHFNPASVVILQTPALVSKGSMIKSTFPDIQPGNWCGKFQRE